LAIGFTTLKNTVGADFADWFAGDLNFGSGQFDTRFTAN
jgi:hypothetical protein